MKFALETLGECQLCNRRGVDAPVAGQFRQDRVSSIAVVGERPGRDEGLVGRPFDDKAGLLLRRCLLLAGIRPEDCLLSLLVRCGLDAPKASEASLCFSWLEAELAAARPGVIVALGNTSARTLTKNKNRLHGNPVILTGPSHHGLSAGGRKAEAALIELLTRAKELACSPG